MSTGPGVSIPNTLEGTSLLADDEDIPRVSSSIKPWFASIFLKPLWTGFKKLFASGSIEEEAMQIFMAKKKAEDMREQLRTLIIYSRGMGAWNELLKTEADVRKRRQKMIYDQKERQKKLIDGILIGFLILILTGAIVGFIMLLQSTGKI